MHECISGPCENTTILDVSAEHANSSPTALIGLVASSRAEWVSRVQQKASLTCLRNRWVPALYYAPMYYLSSTFEFSPRVEHNVHSISASRSQERRKYRWPVVYWWNRTLVYVCYFNVLLAPWGSAGRGDLTASKAPCTRALYTSFGSKRGRLMAQQSRFRLPCACRKRLG